MLNCSHKKCLVFCDEEALQAGRAKGRPGAPFVDPAPVLETAPVQRRRGSEIRDHRLTDTAAGPERGERTGREIHCHRRRSLREREWERVRERERERERGGRERGRVKVNDREQANRFLAAGGIVTQTTGITVIAFRCC